MRTYRTAATWRVFASVLFFAFWTSCKKDLALSENNIAVPSITVEEAKRFFTSQTPASIASSRTDSTETQSAGPTVLPDWGNAVAYFDEIKQQSVVEVPLLQGSFSRQLINPENTPVDTAAFLHSPANDRLIIVRDIQGVTDYAIMKVAGTYHYSLTNETFASNTYGQMDSLFAGMVSFVDIYDRVRQVHYRHNGRFYDIDSIRTEELGTSGVQDRWELICIRVYTAVPCPCEGHLPGDHCKCDTKPRVIESEICFDANVIGGGGTGTPTFNPNPQWGSGGSNTTNSTNTVSCFIMNVAAFDAKYGTDLLTDYEDIALACNGGCDSVAFEACVLKGLAILKHQQLIATYSEYASRNINIDSFLAQHGVQKYLAAATLYETFQEGGWPDLPDLETLRFYLELFEKYLLPIGITFVPYGIGDIADIFQSCDGGLSWDCVVAIVGIAVPFDELMDIWRKSDKVKAAWKTVKGFGGMKQAWSLIQNCPKIIRTDADILAKVQGAISRGVKSVPDMISHANVPYINQATIEHIFRGSNGGGVHHISVLVDNTGYKLFDRTDTGLGCYKAKVQKPDGSFMFNKDFFPDDWDELKVIDEIKVVWGNAQPATQFGSNAKLGYGNSGVPILIFTSNGKITTAYPQF